MQLTARVHTMAGRRHANQDSALVREGIGVFAVADGMGGYEGGEVASALVGSAIEEVLERHARDPDSTWPIAADPGRSVRENLVVGALRFAHRRVRCARRGRLSRMGSTAAVLVFGHDAAVVGHVGDSRVYLHRDGATVRLTRDHSMAEELAVRSEGVEAIAAQYRHILTRAVGMDGPLGEEVRTIDVRRSDTFLLCSDGLWEPLGQPALEAALRDRCDPWRLCQLAFESGSTDNITAVQVTVA